MRVAVIVRTHPYSHPLHMKIVKHVAWGWHWCGIYLDWPCMCLNLMWDQFWLGLQPQSMHFTIILFAWVTQISRWIPKVWWMRAAIVVRTHPYSHPLHMKIVKDLAWVWHWCGIDLDWVYSLNHCTSPSFVAQELPRFLGEFPKFGQWERP
jgi:hypothetical protein